MPRSRWTPFLALLLLGAIPAALEGQAPPPPDTAPGPSAVRQPLITVERATVVAFGPTLPDSSDVMVAAWRDVSRRLGFGLLLAEGAPPLVVGKRKTSMFFTPLDVPAGFVVAVPGSPSHLVPGLVGPDSLERGIRYYLATVRPFSR